MEALSIKLPAALKRKLAVEATRRNVSQSAIVRECIEQALAGAAEMQPQESCAAIARDLTGSVRSGRSDLGSNKRLLAEVMLADERRLPDRRR